MTKAKRFNLTELLNQRSVEQPEEGEGRDTGGTERQKEEIVLVDVYDLEPSKENFYQVDDGLKRSVELVGILQPLLVKRPENGKYKVIAGHRRRLAVLALMEEGKEGRRYVPCVFKKEDVRDRLAIILANRFRDKTDWEKMMEVVEAEGLARELKEDYQLGGRTREVLAEMMGMSQGQIGRYKAIYNHLDAGLMEEFREGTIGFSAASELCGLPGESQRAAVKQVREKGGISLPDILDYALADGSPAPMETCEFNLKNNLGYGGNEGIYLDFQVERFPEGQRELKGLGIFKTLQTDKEAMHTMAALLADFIIEMHDYVNQNLDDFTWTGVDVRPLDDSGNRLNWGYTCSTREAALKRKDELLETYPCVVVRENASRKEEVYFKNPPEAPVKNIS